MTFTESANRGIDRQLLVESIVIMIISAALFAYTFTFDRVPEIFAQGIQPTVFPRAVLFIMFVLSAIQAYKAVRLSTTDVGNLKLFKSVPAIVFLTAAMLIVFVMSMRWVGTFPTLFVFCPALSLLWGERRWMLMLSGFGLFIAFAYVLFVIVMKVPLP